MERYSCNHHLSIKVRINFIQINSPEILTNHRSRMEQNKTSNFPKNTSKNKIMIIIYHTTKYQTIKVYKFQTKIQIQTCSKPMIPTVKTAEASLQLYVKIREPSRKAQSKTKIILVKVGLLYSRYMFSLIKEKVNNKIIQIKISKSINKFKI